MTRQECYLNKGSREINQWVFTYLLEVKDYALYRTVQILSRFYYDFSTSC